MNNVDRRRFLKQCAALGLTGTAAASALRSAQAADRPSGYRAIVGIYLQGGNDLNMLVPTDDDQYQRYRDLRGGLGIAKDNTLGITSNNAGGNTKYGLHPATAGLKELYDNGNLAFVANAGALKAPLNITEFEARTKPIPSKLFAHNSQSEFVLTGLPREGERLSGWAGRIADSYNIPLGRAPMNVAMGNNSVWQRGLNTKAFSFGSGVGPVQHYRTDIPVFETLYSRGLALEELNAFDGYDNVFANEHARQSKESLAVSQLFSGDKLADTNLTAQIPNTFTGKQFQRIAKLINSRSLLGQQQQIFYVYVPGWDFHSGLLGRQNNRLKQLSDALNGFYKATAELGVANEVTTFTVSDFGRTLTGNGQGGSDHGWGGNQIVMGGAVNGGKVYGEYPKLMDGDPHYLTGRGSLIPTIAQDQISGTIAKWFGGFNDNELDTLLPNLQNFSVKDLGFLNNA